MDLKTIVSKSKLKLLDIAKLLVAGKEKEGYTAFGVLVKDLAIRDPRLVSLLSGLIVSSVRAHQNPRAFEDPLTAFEDPLTAFEDPLTAFEDPLTAFKDPRLVRLMQTLIGTTQL